MVKKRARTVSEKKAIMPPLVWKAALANRKKFGKAQVGVVISKLIAADPSFKKKIGAVSKDVAGLVDTVNRYSEKEFIEQCKLHDVHDDEKPHESGAKLKELPNALLGTVVTRLPPEPSKHLHIGHALSFLINSLYAQKYQGRCALRFEDTNPALCDQTYVDSITHDVQNYLQIPVDQIAFASDFMKLFYTICQDMILSGNAYPCTCSREAVKEGRMKMLECPCRSADADSKNTAWEGMLNGEYEDGEITIRLRGDMKSQNAVMRDPILFRVSHAKHYRHGTLYSVWPGYDFANVVMDHEQGITHVMRSAEFGEVRIELQNYLRSLLKFPNVTIVQYGRFTLAGGVTKGREIRALIQEKKVSGWDDPRLTTLMALRRRGIQVEALRELAVEVGLSKTETTFDWQMLAAINRKYIDKKAHRYFFIHTPVAITLEGALERTIQLNLHPENERGGRHFKVSKDFLIEESDLQRLGTGKLHRLMECLNFEKKNGAYVFVSLDHESYKQRAGVIMHWLPKDEHVPVSVLMPDGSTHTGIAETTVNKVQVGQIVQFERFGFCRLEARGTHDKGAQFIFCHR